MAHATLPPSPTGADLSQDRTRLKRSPPIAPDQPDYTSPPHGGRISRTTRRRPTMEIKRSGAAPSGKGPADYFTGTVRIDPLFSPPPPARVVAASVTFEPGART